MSELTATLTDDLDNWADAQVFQRGLLKTASDTLNNWADAITRQGTYLLNLDSDLNSWQEGLRFIYNRGADVSDTLSFSDAVLVSLLGQYSQSFSDDLDNWGDAVVLQSDWKLKLEDTLNNWNSDINIVQDILLSVSDDADNLSDEVLAALIAGLVVTVSSNLNSWDDSVTTSFLSRLALSKRVEMIPYLRRYLNDVEQPVVKELRVSFGDSVNNFGDGLGT